MTLVAVASKFVIMSYSKTSMFGNLRLTGGERDAFGQWKGVDRANAGRKADMNISRSPLTGRFEVTDSARKKALAKAGRKLRLAAKTVKREAKTNAAKAGA